MYNTPLHKATTAEEIEQLLDAGRWIEDPGWMGATPLHSAAERGLADVASALIRRGARVDARRPERLDTPLHFAANADVARVLIEGGADVEALDWSKRTPLHWAAQFGRLDVAELLIRSGAEIDRPADDGATPLHWAAREGHAAVVQLLLREGAKANRKDGAGRTPLHFAAWRGWVEAVELLLGAGADPGLRDKGGRTPLHEARSLGREEITRRLEAAQGESARAERATVAPPAERALALMRVRAHPARPEAVTVAEHATLHRWALGESAEILAGLQAPHAWFNDAVIDPRAEVIAVGTPDETVELRRWDDFERVAEFALPAEERHGIQALDLSPDGRWLAVADSREQLHLIERSTGRVVATTDAGERTHCLRFDPSSSQIATACSFQGGGSVRIDRIEGGRLVHVKDLPRSDRRTSSHQFVDTLPHLAFSRDGRRLALFGTSAIGHDSRPRGWRGDVVMYELGSKTPRWIASIDARMTGDRRSLGRAGHEMGFLTEVLFVDDETLACGATRGHVLFFRVTDGRLIRKVQVHPKAAVVSLALEPSRGVLWAALGAGGGTLVRVPRGSPSIPSHPTE
jgi:ankyrin repeat protein